MQKIIQLELNEVNFEFVKAYCARGKLPMFGELIRRHGLIETTAEQAYQELEPWIQWVSAHTGLTFAEHGVFRLGDIREREDHRQIWEILEANGRSVAALSPMNARNACRRAEFFMPDPWTGGEVTGGQLLSRLYEAISQIVNSHAGGRPKLSSLAWLLAGLARYASSGNYPRYLTLAKRSLNEPWARPLLLDALLADVFVTECRRSRPDFASLFLNAAAHLQHHHMFDAEVYEGPHRNPDWYRSAEADPIFEVYALYDRIVAAVCRAFPKHRIVIATGLHQIPYPELLFYWRLNDHARFLKMVGVRFASVEPRMSRDFLVRCDSPEAALTAERRLSEIVADDEELLFDVDNRGDSLFVVYRYPHDIGGSLGYTNGEQRFENLRAQSDFVAIKNGDHDGIGYVIDTSETAGLGSVSMPLTDLFQRTVHHFASNANLH